MYKILIVDDDKARLVKLKAVFRDIGINDEHIDWAESLIDAKTKIKKCKYDFLIIDIVLPNRSGDERLLKDGGIKLLEELQRRDVYKKPSHIVGITANLEDHLEYQQKFQILCKTVILVERNSDSWIESIKKTVIYNLDVKHNAGAIDIEYALVTIHGIRTFGEWQERLFKLISNRTSEITPLHYKYGYLDIISFLIPFLRNRSVNRLYIQLKDWCDHHSAKKFIFVSHSFGTYILLRSLQRLIESKYPIQIDKVLLAGSVIKSNIDWGAIAQSRLPMIVNDCGTHDFVLWLSNIFAPGLGMAGKTGFKWINSKDKVNRYFAGGHSLYFQDENGPTDKFMEKYWLPIILDEATPDVIDERKNNLIHHGVFESVVKLFGVILYPMLFLILLYIFS